MIRFRRTTAGSAAAAILLSASLLSGCSGATPDEPAPTPTDAASATAGSARRISPEDMPSAPPLRKAKGAVADATFGACATGPGAQRVTGTITNSTQDPHDYVITMNWTNDTFDVLGRGIAVARNLDPGASADFTINATVADGATTCTPNVIRGQLR